MKGTPPRNYLMKPEHAPNRENETHRPKPAICVVKVLQSGPKNHLQVGSYNVDASEIPN